MARNSVNSKVKKSKNDIINAIFKNIPQNLKIYLGLN